MEGRLTPVLKLTKLERTRGPAEATLNRDLDILDASLGAVDTRLDALEAGGGGGAPTGPAGGDLAGSYPNPTLAAGAVDPTNVAAGTYAISISGNAATATSAPPSGAAGGDLTGSFPSPQIADGTITSAKIADGTIATGDIANQAILNAKLGLGAVHAENIGNFEVGTNALAGLAVTSPKLADGAVTLAKLSPAGLAVPTGGGAGQVLTKATASDYDAAWATPASGGMSNPMVSNQDLIVGELGGAPTRLPVGSNGQVLTLTGAPAMIGWAAPAATPSPPTGAAGGDLSGSYPNPQIAAGVITDADVNALNKDGLAATPSLRTLGTGAQQAAAGNDGRFTNARTPTAHATTHQPGGSDAMAVDAAAATGSLRTLGTSATSAAAGNDGRLTDSRAPTGAASGHLSGTYPGPSIATAVVTDSHVAAANKDGVAGTASMRTLGTGAAQAAAGNHAHAGMVSNPMTTAADLIVGGASGTPARLGVGASSQVLTVVGGVLTWATPASGGMTNPMTSQGDLITAVDLGGVPGRLGIGATNTVLTVVGGLPVWRAPAAVAPLAHATTHQPGGSDPLAVDAVAATGSLRTLGTGATQAAPGNDSRFGSGGPPTGAASGHLTGTYPGPSIAPLVVTDGHVVAANKDGLAATPSLRTLGTGAQQASAGTHTHGAAAPAAHATTHQPGGADAMAVDAAAGTGSLRTLGTSATSAAAGNDGRLSDSRAPTGSASGHLTGTYPGPSIAGGVVTDVHVATANKDGVVGLASMRTIGAGATQAAAGNHTHGAAAPAAHATTHQPGGSDAMAVDAAAATGSLRTLGTSATAAAAGNDARLSDSRAPSGTAGGDLSGTYPSPQIAAGVIVDADVATANKDGAAATPSLRTLGAGAAQAAAGNHAHATYVTNPMTAVADLIVGGASGAPTRLGVGASSQVLTVVGGVLTWVAPASGGMANPMTSVGDLIAGGASGAAQRLGVGTTDQVLSVVAGAPAWASPRATDNLLTNGSMDIWQRGAGPFTTNVFGPDRWQISIGSGTVSLSRDSANTDTGSAFCAAMVVAGATPDIYLLQRLEDYTGLRGQTITVAARVRTATATAVRLGVYDSVSGWRWGTSYHTGSGAYETMTFSVATAAAATAVQVAVRITAAATAYVDNCTLVVGAAAASYAPLHPADELARCQRYYETLGGGATLERFCALQCWSTTRANGVLAWKVPKAVTPTVTVSAASTFAVQTAAAAAAGVTVLTPAVQTPRSCDLDASVAGGLVAGNASLLYANSSLSALISIEANP